MRVLLLAYEYPPIQSGQSIRWFYLANELASHGVQVDVVAPRFADLHGFGRELHPNVTVFRTFAGPFVGGSSWLAERTKSGGDLRTHAPASAPGFAERSYRLMRRGLDRILFPDVRTEWFPFAWREVCRRMRTLPPDVVISSHEPGVTLLLGLAIRRRWRKPWLVDLGDPVAGAWTPHWRRALDLSLERAVMRAADRIHVTCEETRQLLQDRHNASRAPGNPLAILPMGFAPRKFSPTAPTNEFRLVYTGSLYPGRRAPDALITAVRSLGHRDIRLVLAGSKEQWGGRFGAADDRIEELGMIDHNRCLQLQQDATVLVNLGYTDSYLLPGKLLEYFGAARPILHVSADASDPSVGIVNATKRGVVVAASSEAIATAIDALYAQWKQGTLDGAFDLSSEAVSEYAWPALGTRLFEACRELAGKP